MAGICIRSKIQDVFKRASLYQRNENKMFVDIMSSETSYPHVSAGTVVSKNIFCKGKM